jgi:hypothetical protein
MTPSIFRSMIVAHWALVLAGGTLGWIGHGHPDSLREAYLALPQPWFLRHDAIVLPVAAILAALMLAGTVGLFQFKRWGRTLSLWLTAIGLALSWSFGVVLSGGLEWMLHDAAMMLWGAALACAYWSPLAARFAPSGASDPNARASQIRETQDSP